MHMREDRRGVDNEQYNEKEAPIEPPTDQFHTKRTKEVHTEHISPTAKPCKPPVPYS